MGLSPAERQARYRQKKYQQLDKLPKVKCACGCGELIPIINKLGKLAKYKIGHNISHSGIETRFKKGQKAWNKGLKCYWVGEIKRGKKISQAEIDKRTETRLKNNNGIYQIKSGWKHKPLTIALMTLMNKTRALKGQDNPAWLGGKSFEEYGYDFSDELKSSILRRDGRRCVSCGASDKRLVVHHIDANKKNNDSVNLQTLCDSCHGKLHGKILQNFRVEVR